MGGHKAGEVASRLALDYLALNWLSIETADSIDRCIQEMNLQIVKEALKDPSMSNMGTTLAGVLIRGSQFGFSTSATVVCMVFMR